MHESVDAIASQERNTATSKKRPRDVARVSAVVLEEPHAPSWCDAHTFTEGKIMVARETDALEEPKLPAAFVETYVLGACTHQFGRHSTVV